MTQDLPAAALARRALLLAAPLVMLGTVPTALAQAEAVPVRFAYNPNDLDVPRHVVDVYARTLEGAGLLRGAKPAGFDQAVDLTCLKRAHAELGLRWDDAKTLD